MPQSDATDSTHASTLQRLRLRRPDDWHVHLRDDAMLAAVASFTAQQCARAIVMPNLAPPITTVAAADAYRVRILASLDPDTAFTPLMTLYLTDDMDPSEIQRGHDSGVITACKLYPANATTNSAHGVTNVRNIHRVLEILERLGMPLLVHGEVTDPDIDIFDREAVFIERILAPMLSDFPALKVVFEHITTADAVDFVLAGGARLGATVTPHHLQINRNALFAGGLRPHAYCLPVAKRERHRLALRKAVASGNRRFFMGTDSAPHDVHAKESACGCAGIFNAPVALQSYAQVFDEEGVLDRLEAFTSENGPRFYGLPLNDTHITLERAPDTIPARLQRGAQDLVPFHAGTILPWRIVKDHPDKSLREQHE